MIRSNSAPRISVNKLGEYIVSRPRRQRAIVFDQKYPRDYIVAYYRDAQDAITKFICGGMEDIGDLEGTIRILDQRSGRTTHETRRLTGNIDAIETFMEMLDDIDLKGAVARPGDNAPPRMATAGVEVSVRPEIVLAGQGVRGRELVGAVKLHFPRSQPLSEEAAGFVSAASQLFCERFLYQEGTAYGPYCPVIDVASRRFHAGVRSVTDRRKEIEEACAGIALLWPTL